MLIRKIKEMIKGQVLLLNADYDFLRVVDMERAVSLMLRRDNPARVEVPTGDKLHSAGGLVLDEPSVLVLTEYTNVRGNIRKANIRRKRIFTRDKYRCSYCGKKFPEHLLTLDHVFPASRGGADAPENIVAACKPCNNRKADRTPEEAGMKLLNKPKPINFGAKDVMRHSYAERHPEWRDYLHLGEGDSRYAHVE